MNNYIEYFTNYVEKNYDMNNDLISKKYYHSLRVAKLMMLLAKRIGLNEDDILLAFKIGLCHDLGRFYEVIRIGHFDNKVFDHGAYSNKILYNDSFINYMDVNEHVLFRKAIYYHNKKELNNDLTNREMLFSNMIRDMDKIDIIGLRKCGSRLRFDNPSKNVINNFINNQPIDIHYIKNSSDSTILYLSFIKDLVLNESYDISIYGGYLDEFLPIIDVIDDSKILFDKLINKISERRGKIYVR